jgi:predicted MPP superfamily phosphohydrolase
MLAATILIIAGLFFLTAAFWYGLVTRVYTVQSDKIKKSITLVLVTDLHSRIYGKNQKNIMAKIKKARPDIILLGGDIYDLMLSMPVKGAEQFLEAVKHIAPIYYVTGNHDMVVQRRISDLKESIAARGITVLDSKYIETEINGGMFIIAGVDDPGTNRKGDTDEYKQELEEAWENNISSCFKDVKEDSTFKILLSHRPEKTNIYAGLPFDLILSGHAHGGQWRIPFILNGFFAPHQGFFPKYAGGLYKYGGKTHIVSRGASVQLRFPRIFNPPEVVIVKIKSAESAD